MTAVVAALKVSLEVQRLCRSMDMTSRFQKVNPFSFMSSRGLSNNAEASVARWQAAIRKLLKCSPVEASDWQPHSSAYTKAC